MDNISIVPVYQVTNGLRKEISDQLATAAQLLLTDNFEQAAEILIDTARVVRVLETILEAE